MGGGVFRIVWILHVIGLDSRTLDVGLLARFVGFLLKTEGGGGYLSCMVYGWYFVVAVVSM